MSAMTRELADDVFLVVRAAFCGHSLETVDGAYGDAQLVLTRGLDRKPLGVEAKGFAPQWQPLVMLRDEDATWEDAEWQ